MRAMLDSLLPQVRLEADLREILSAKEIELGKERISVDEQVRLELISRSFHANEIDVGFCPTYYRAVLAIGGVSAIDHGIVEAGICFATLWYTGDRQLITVDFSVSPP